ncbi:uncharacterized protein LOC116806258 [Drosophila grimshawi]|uniref:uncharacterized protein LOC116806258 n=1 Tax=Drosophila grimshawi TaxID=7222 RepID=UPI001C9339A2|nr:uncharacterized protein LOC116806258 [Drosophila grimshawi]
MYIVSTSKKTILSDFADLETKSTFLHANGEATDFQFNAQRRVFVEVDKKAGLTVMRIKEKQENVPEIQRVRKLTIENAYSVCCAKTACNQIAIGQSSGFVKLFNFSTAQLIHSYPANQSSSTVLYVDYNCTDDYIAAVLEGGQINIYGTRTKQKMESITIDEYSTLARFHPSKRFHLGVASFKGTVTVYDVQAKRSIFHLEDAHDAPCRDVSMCSGQPSLLVTVGYDCKINIFDIRRNKAQAPSGRLEYTHPMSTVALSECGTYFCAGNLKGELVSYDMRSTKAPLAVRSVHDGCAVTRCAFVPTPTEEQQSSSFSNLNNVTMDGEPIAMTQQQLDSLATAKASRQTRDSFCDFLDAKGPHGMNRISTQLTKALVTRRDSFDWESLQPKEERQTINQNGSGLSSLDSAASSTVDSQLTVSGPLQDRSNISGDAKLKRISEVEEHISVANDSIGNDKEYPQMADAAQKQRLRMLPSSRNSTPHHVAATATQAATLQLLPKTSSNESSNGENRVQLDKEQAEQRKRMDERFAKLERELKASDEQTRCLLFTEVKKYWTQQLEHTKYVHDALELLLRSDRVMNDFNAMQQENDLLEAQVAHLLRQQGSGNA